MNEQHVSHSGSRRRVGPSIPAVARLLAIAGLLASASPGVAFAQGDEGQAPEPWQRAELPFTQAGLDLWDVTTGGPGFIAVGGGFADGREQAKALVLVSSDGYAWDQVELAGVAARGSIRAITVTAEGYVAVGSGGPGTAAVWRSADGLAWERVPDAPALDGAFMLDVTSTTGGLVAVGCSGQLECGGGLAWTSPDGLDWSAPVTLDFLPMGIASTTAGLLALGASEPYGGQAALATSADGVTWGPPTSFEATGSLHAAEQLPDAILAAGGSTKETGDSTMLLTTSPDGLSWQTLEAPATRVWVEDLVALPDGWLFVGWESRRGETRPATRVGSDPADLARIAFPREVKEGGLLHAGAVGPTGETMVVVGTTILNRGSVPTVWVRGPGTDTAG